MKAVAVSDLHGVSLGGRRLKRILEEEKPEVLLILGDILGGGYGAEIISAVKEFKGRVFAVRGNCDDGSEGLALGLDDLPYNLRWSFEGHDVHMQHKPFYALSFPVGDILLFGHTHFKCLYKEHGVIYCNPGSLSLPRDECASYAVFENGTIVLKHGDDGSLISSLSL